MPPTLALLLTVGFVLFLFRLDHAEKSNVTRATWIPLLWMLIISSRFVSGWLNTFGFEIGGISLEEGSPIDAAVFLTLILSAAFVLKQRTVSWSEIIACNRWLTVFFIYGFIAITWSDFPFVAFKRWIKIVGHPLMVLILFTEPDPEEAINSVLRRCAYILIPTSILFIKYYPSLGRGYDAWSGTPSNCGVTTNKNELGYLCLIFGYFFFWTLLKSLSRGRVTTRWDRVCVAAVFLCMIGWLLFSAHSATALVSLVVGGLFLVVLGLPFVNLKHIGTYIISGVVVALVCELAFGISAQALKLLGRDSTLTDRTEIWHDVLQIPINPILGAGFESFWLGERREKMWAKWSWEPNQAHNGYLETYLNLGLVGLFILAALLLATFWKARRELFRNFELGRFRLGFLFVVLVYNWTEASFKALHVVWFVFYIIAIDYPRIRSSRGIPPGERSESMERLGAPQHLVCEGS